MRQEWLEQGESHDPQGESGLAAALAAPVMAVFPPIPASRQHALFNQDPL
jgi:hypothetical protein